MPHLLDLNGRESSAFFMGWTLSNVLHLCADAKRGALPTGPDDPVDFVAYSGGKSLGYHARQLWPELREQTTEAA